MKKEELYKVDDMTIDDVKMLIECGWVEINKDFVVKWKLKKYHGLFEGIKDLIQSYPVFLFDNQFYTEKETVCVEIGYKPELLFDNSDDKPYPKTYYVTKELYTKRYVRNLFNQQIPKLLREYGFCRILKENQYSFV